MAYFAVEYVFAADQRHLPVRPVHRTYLAGLADEGRLVLSGPLTSDTGGLLIFRADSESEVRELLKRDPYAESGVLDQVRVEQWNPVLGYLAAHLQRDSSGSASRGSGSGVE